MTRALLDRLATFYNEEPATRVMAGAAHWPGGGSFGDPLADLRSLVVHMTAGWPSRNRVEGFVDRYIVAGTPKRGLGTQFYLAGDGTMMRMIDLPLHTGHASYVNDVALGVETGNLGDGDPGGLDLQPPTNHRWRQLNQDAATQANDDIPGMKAWLVDQRSDAPREVIVAWWTTDAFAGPARQAITSTTNLFSEMQYRTLALLARYLAEERAIPRNIPLLPHDLRADLVSDGLRFRRILLAEPGFAQLVTELAADGVGLAAIDFDPANLAGFDALYDAEIQAISATMRRRNRAWTSLNQHYRGFHGHGFGGALRRDLDDKRSCPGPVFDWHRFGREISDFWWLPFDVDGASTATPRRAYLDWDGDTPTHEFYFEESAVMRILRNTTSVHGAAASPMTFALDPASPVYAMANGELVAAQLPARTAGKASAAFMLLRHELFHAPHPLSQPIAGGFALFPSIPFTVMPDAIDHSLEPTYVYTLYMHLATDALDLEQVSADNPDWLNRLLIYEKECDLGVTFYGAAGHHGFPDAAWDQPMPGGGVRPTLRESWAIDQLALDVFLDALRRGDLAVAPPARDPTYRPIRVVLGDFLGRGGVRSTAGGTDHHGIRIEVFSTALLPTFVPVLGVTDWTVPSTNSMPAVFYTSEWARMPTPAELVTLLSHGMDLVPLWWRDVATTTAWNDLTLPAAAQLPANGMVWHYRLFDVARWINGLTWNHERHKYRDPVAAASTVPRLRRV